MRQHSTAQKSRLAFVATVLGLCGLLSLTAGAERALAQNPFSPAYEVNDRIVSFYEIGQRVRFLEVLNAPGNLEETAREALVNERLQAEVAERLGLSPSAEEVAAGMEEFAARANLSADALVEALGREGVSAETFRDFVANGIAWRNVVRTRFGPRAQVTEAEIDRALTLATSTGGAQINMAELIVPVTPQNANGLRNEMQALTERLNGSIGGFSQAARQFSASPSARNGGGLGWRPLSALPPQLQAILLPMAVGDVTDPIPLGGQAFAIFQMRGIEETSFVTPEVAELDYAQVLIPGGQSAEAQAAASALRNEIDTCDDLYGVRPGGFERVSQSPGEVPRDIAVELMRLDANEISTGLTRGGAMVFLMLCERATALPEGGREEVQQALFQQRLESYASSYLAELRADAIITEY